jgi:ribonuclease P protein component
MSRRRESLPRESRITRRQDFERAKRRGTWYRGKLLDFIVTVGAASGPRFGSIVPLYGHAIVERNTVKRRIREIVRRDVLPSVTDRVDIVVLARRSAYGADFSRLREELETLARRACEKGPTV